MGVRLDDAGAEWAQNELDTGNKIVHLEGRLTLNYVKVRCIADIDSETLTGQGRLEVVEISD